MKHLTEWGFQSLGLLVVITGWLVVTMTTLLGLLWLADVALTKCLRAADTFGILLRFAWLSAKEKRRLRSDMEEEERQRKLPYVPPVDDEDEDPECADDVVMRVMKKPDQRCECIVLPQGRCGRTPAGLFKLRGWDKPVMTCKRCEEFPHSHDLESDGQAALIRDPKELVFGCECLACRFCGERPAGRVYRAGEPRAIGQVLCAHCEKPGHDKLRPWPTHLKDSPTPAGSVSDSDMLPDASGSQSREPGESKARQGHGEEDSDP